MKKDNTRGYKKKKPCYKQDSNPQTPDHDACALPLGYNN